MKWVCFVYLSMLANVSLEHRSEVMTLGRANNSEFASEFQMDGSTLDVKPAYSRWGPWSRCGGGQRARRRFCLRPEACGRRVREEVVRAIGANYPPSEIQGICNFVSLDYAQVSESCISTMDLETRKNKLKNHTPQRRQLSEHPRRATPPGFSGWSPWSPCSRRCTTMRRRVCRRPELCLDKVVRESAYCYTEGGFCQRWLRLRTGRRWQPAKPAAAGAGPERAAAAACGRAGRGRRARLRGMLRIIGGRPAPPGKWPWQVAVLNHYREVFCGGTLVSLRWVVSAAHCARRRLRVRLGERDTRARDRGELEMRVAYVVVHPAYDPDTVVNDVAMFRLPAPARPELGHGVACLPRAGLQLAPLTPCTILGWGKRRATDVHGTRLLYETEIATVPQAVCRRSYWLYAITDSMVCAGRGRRDSCAGDSGGPLLCPVQGRYYLQGITSFGDGCGKLGKYGIYTRTASYVPWMHDVMSHRDFNDVR